MTVEGIAGNEEFPTPAHNAALPFTRFLTGPADYTCCWYSNKLKVTHAHQLALPVIYFSPWQVLFWYDRPSEYRGDPALDYWKELPTCWDETRVLADRIGRCASVARRRGTEWFVGTINPGGGDVPIPLSFLEPGVKYAAIVYSDRDVDDPTSKAVKAETIPVDRTTILKPRMPINGGHAVRIVRATEQ
jgi:alpha-glucosidase